MRIKNLSQLSPQLQRRILNELGDPHEPTPTDYAQAGRLAFADSEPKLLHLTIEGKVVPIKNSKRCIGNGKSVMSKGAHRWLEDAKNQLGQQYQHTLLTGTYDLDVVFYYRNFAHWLDSDNALSSVLDALKGCVILDDSPRFIRRATSTPDLDENRAYCDIILRRYSGPYAFLDARVQP